MPAHPQPVGSKTHTSLSNSPFASGRGASRRPALVVHNKRDNDPAQLLIPRATPAGQQAGVLQDSVVSCTNLATVHEERIHRVIGHLPAAVMDRLDECLKAA